MALGFQIEMLVFVEEGKPEYSEKNPQSKDENQQQTHDYFWQVLLVNWRPNYFGKLTVNER